MVHKPSLRGSRRCAKLELSVVLVHESSRNSITESPVVVHEGKKHGGAARTAAPSAVRFGVQLRRPINTGEKTHFRLSKIRSPLRHNPCSDVAEVSSASALCTCEATQKQHQTNLPAIDRAVVLHASPWASTRRPSRPRSTQPLSKIVVQRRKPRMDHNDRDT